MTDFILRHRGVKGFDGISFEVKLISLVKQSVNKSYPNLSNCCKEPLKQTKRCGKCQADIQGNPDFKLAEIGKERFILPAARLQEIKDSFNSPVVEVLGFVDSVNELYLTDKVYQVSCDKKFSKDYNEYAQALKASGKIAVALANINATPYPVIMKFAGDTLILRCLTHAGLIRENTETPTAATNAKKVELMAKVMTLNQTAELRTELLTNERQQAEENLIEAAANGTLAELPSLPQPEAKTDNEEMAAMEAALQVTA